MPSGTRVWRTSITESGVAISGAFGSSISCNVTAESLASITRQASSVASAAISSSSTSAASTAGSLSFDPISSSTRMSLPNPSTSNRAVPMTCQRFGPSTEAYSFTPIKSTPAAVMLTSKSTDVITMNGENWMRASKPHEPYTPKPITSASSVKSAPHCTELDVSAKYDMKSMRSTDPAVIPNVTGRRSGKSPGGSKRGWNPPTDIRNAWALPNSARSAMSPERAKPTTCESCRLASIASVPASKSIAPATSRLRATSARSLLGSTALSDPSTTMTSGSGSWMMMPSSASISAGVPQPILTIGPNT